MQKHKDDKIAQRHLHEQNKSIQTKNMKAHRVRTKLKEVHTDLRMPQSPKPQEGMKRCANSACSPAAPPQSIFYSSAGRRQQVTSARRAVARSKYLDRIIVRLTGRHVATRLRERSRRRRREDRVLDRIIGGRLALTMEPRPSGFTTKKEENGPGSGPAFLSSFASTLDFFLFSFFLYQTYCLWNKCILFSILAWPQSTR